MTTALSIPSIPGSLVDEIVAGNCVAFVGAGFSIAAGLPTWGGLLKELSLGTDADTRSHIEGLVAEGSAHALDQAAQVLEDKLARKRLVEMLRGRLGAPPLNDAIQNRLDLLKGIPFRAILTTNFDGVLNGMLPGPASYRGVLRPVSYRWWDKAFWESGEGAQTMKLHGDLTAAARDKEIVFTRRDYRRRLYSDPAYTTFLRSVFSANTVLYLGFSFADAYLNELRSEVLSLLGHTGREAPVAYAVINDVSVATQRHFLSHEGIHIITYNTRSRAGARDFSGFERILRAIHDKTNPLYRFAILLSGKRILWVDPQPENNETGLGFLRRAAEAGNTGACTVDMVPDPDTACARLAACARSGTPYDLTITHWGEKQVRGGKRDGTPAGVRLLEQMRRSDLRCPVLVFSTSSDVDARKRSALSLGAQGYCFTWERLFQSIEQVLADGLTTG